MKTYACNTDVTVIVRGGVLMACTDTDDCLSIDAVLPPSLQGESEWWNRGRCTVKMLEVQPGARLSDQRHARRGEQWTILTPGVEIVIEMEGGAIQTIHPSVGERIDIPVHCWHRLGALSQSSTLIQVFELSTGEFSEDDIERRSDDYGRV